MARALTISTVVATISLVTSAGCFRSLPPPEVRHLQLAPDLSYHLLCGNARSRANLTVRLSPPLSGALECSTERATVALFNPLRVRVRTITISRTGAVLDENSYLSPYDEPAAHVISEIGAALHKESTCVEDTQAP